MTSPATTGGARPARRRRPRTSPRPTTTTHGTTPVAHVSRTSHAVHPVEDRLPATSDAGHPEGTPFADLGLPAALVTALATAGRTVARPIQAATCRDALAGRDVLGRAATGSGKTLAFGLPMLTRLAAQRPARRVTGSPRALVLVPTRELAVQVQTELAPLAAALGLSTAVVFGGVGAKPQISALRGGVDVLIACPGRLIDHVKTRNANLDAVDVCVLDEADHMADLGFLPGVRFLLGRISPSAQKLLFSATLDNAVGTLVDAYLTSPVTHAVAPPTATVSTMEHRFLPVTMENKLATVADLVTSADRSIVFTRTKHGAKALARRLSLRGDIDAVCLQGNMSQNARNAAMAAFHEGRARVLVATDIAARGIHVDDVAQVVHFDPPTEAKAYLHRSGRTARSGASGVVITLVLPEQTRDVTALKRAAGLK